VSALGRSIKSATFVFWQHPPLFCVHWILSQISYRPTLLMLLWWTNQFRFNIACYGAVKFTSSLSYIRRLYEFKNDLLGALWGGVSAVTSNTGDVDTIQYDLGSIDTEWSITEFSDCVDCYRLRTNERTYCHKMFLFNECRILTTSSHLLRVRTGIPLSVLITNCNYAAVNHSSSALTFSVFSYTN